MASSPSAQFKKQFDAIVKEFTRKLSNEKVYRDLAEFGADTIVKRTRLGYGVPFNGANKQRLKPLSNSYKQQRAGKLAFFTITNGSTRFVVPYTPRVKPRLDSTTGPNKSNLTFTGELLTSIEVIKAGKGEASIGFRRGTRPGSTLTNEKLNEYIEKQGRIFFRVSRAELEQIRQFLVKKLRNVRV
jgi:hypothetical protein